MAASHTAIPEMLEAAKMVCSQSKKVDLKPSQPQGEVQQKNLHEAK